MFISCSLTGLRQRAVSKPLFRWRRYVLRLLAIIGTQLPETHHGPARPEWRSIRCAAHGGPCTEQPYLPAGDEGHEHVRPVSGAITHRKPSWL